jgi:hypothetical protein
MAGKKARPVVRATSLGCGQEGVSPVNSEALPREGRGVGRFRTRRTRQP